MENTDSYPVFHTRLAWTRRRRFAKPDGTPSGWLILNAADQLTEIAPEPVDLGDITGVPRSDNHDGDDSSRLSIPHPR